MGKLKYRILDLFKSLSEDEERRVRERIIRRCQINPRTLYRYMNYRSDKHNQIGTDHAKIIAEELGVSIEELYENNVND